MHILQCLYVRYPTLKLFITCPISLRQNTDNTRVAFLVKISNCWGSLEPEPSMEGSQHFQKLISTLLHDPALLKYSESDEATFYFSLLPSLIRVIHENVPLLLKICMQGILCGYGVVRIISEQVAFNLIYVTIVLFILITIFEITDILMYCDVDKTFSLFCLSFRLIRETRFLRNSIRLIIVSVTKQKFTICSTTLNAALVCRDPNKKLTMLEISMKVKTCFRYCTIQRTVQLLVENFLVPWITAASYSILVVKRNVYRFEIFF